MQIKPFIVFNGILFAALGVAFVVYGPLMLAFFNVPELNIDSVTYWHLAAFARLFGGGLFGWGLLLWALSRGLDSMAAIHLRSVLFAMTLSCAMVFTIAITQQSSIWLNPAGWVLTGLFGVLTVIYGYFTAIANRPT